MKWWSIPSIAIWLFFGALIFASNAHAALVVTGVTYTYGTQTNVATVYVPPNTAFTANVTVTNTGQTWKGTGWRINTTPPGSLACVNTTDTMASPSTIAIAVTSSATAGANNGYFSAYTNNPCTQSASSTLTATGTVFVDSTVPNIPTATIASNNASPTWAKTGDVVTLTFAVNDNSANVQTPVVTIRGGAAVVAGAYPNYTATRTMLVGDIEGVVPFTINVTDLAGNAATQRTATTSGSNVTFDRTAPTIPTATIASNNASSTMAKTGDIVTLSFTTNDANGVQTPVVSIAGVSATVAGGPSSWTATHTMGAGDTEGTVAFTINVNDPAGNAATQRTAITSGSSVTFDKTLPTLSTVTIASNNANTALAKVGDTVTLTFTASESVKAMPTVTIAGHTVTPTPAGPGTGPYTATYVMVTADTEGVIQFSINFTDLTGNAGTQVTATTNSSSVTFNKTAPTVSSINRANPDPTIAPSVSWTVIFSQTVTGVDATDFTLLQTGVSGAFITAVTGSGVTWTVTVNTGIYVGLAAHTLGLNLVDNDSIINAASIPLGGGGADNGNFTGQVYTISATPALAEYRMDQASWNGTSNEVLDSGTGGFNGDAAGLTTRPTTSIASPAISGSPGTCNYGVFNRSNKDYIALPGGFPDLAAVAGDFTITAWINVANNTLPGQRIFIDDQNNATPGGWGFSVGETIAFGAGGLRFYYRQSVTYTLDTVAIPSNQWLFVALSVQFAAGANASTATIYAWDTTGALVTSNTGTFTWTAGSDPGPPSIGGETNAAGEGTNLFGFGGNLDEVRVYQKVLSQAALTAIAAQTHPCPITAPDHIRIEHDGQALTCQPETVTVKACADAEPTCTLYIGGITGNVIAKSAGGVTLVTVPFTIAAGSGSTTVNVQVTSAQTVTFETSGLSVPPSNPWTCWNGSTASCSMAISACPSGFNCLESTITPYSSGSARLYTKLAGTPSSFDVVALNSAGTVETNYVVSGGTPRSVTVELVDGSGSTACTSRAAINPAFSQTLSFAAADGGRKAAASMTISKAYPDLRCRVTDTNQSPSIVSCSSDDFSVRPGAVTLATSPAMATPPSASSSPSIKAGASFTVSAATTTAATDTYTGTLSQDTFKLTAQITSQDATPVSGGVVGTLSPATLTANATPSNNASYDEVGYLYLAAGAYSDTSFTTVDQAGGDCVAGSSSVTLSGGHQYGCNIGNAAAVSFGRFIPDHFDVSVNANGTMAAACLAGGFTYTGQAMSYVGTTLPSLTIMPMSAASGGHVTQNYQGVFQKLAASGVIITSPTADATQLGKDGATKTALAATMSAGTLANSSGTLTYTLKSDDTFTYTRDANALVGPYTSSSPLAVTAVADGEAAAAGTLPTLSPTGVSLRFGRLRLQNAYGSERLPLAVPLQAQYWAGSAFINNTNDSCTVVSVPAPRTLTGSAVPDGQPNLYFYPPVTGKNELTDAVPTLTSPLGGGKSNLQFAAPLKRGWLDVILNVPNYLIYNWGNCSGQTGTAGLLDDFPCARATFGIYGAKSPIIYRRENY